MENEIPGHKMSSILLYQLLPSTATKVSYDIKITESLYNQRPYRTKGGKPR